MEDRVKLILEMIPKESKQIDSVKQSRQEIYYKLGSIYKDQFDEPQLSNDIFYNLLNFNLDNLYNIYGSLFATWNRLVRMAFYKNL